MENRKGFAGIKGISLVTGIAKWALCSSPFMMLVYGVVWLVSKNAQKSLSLAIIITLAFQAIVCFFAFIAGYINGVAKRHGIVIKKENVRVGIFLIVLNILFWTCWNNPSFIPAAIVIGFIVFVICAACAPVERNVEIKNKGNGKYTIIEN